MAKIFDNILQTIGRTPLVRLNKIGRELPGRYLKARLAEKRKAAGLA